MLFKEIVGNLNTKKQLFEGVKNNRVSHAQLFSGNDIKEDFVELKHVLANIGAQVPTLFKQYTELCEPGGVQFLSFSIDPEFNNCIDGLVLVDLDKVKASKAKRYLGQTR